MQLTLISIGLLLIFLTYFYYPNISKNKLFKEQSIKKDFKESTNDDQVTYFENMEYKGLYDFDKPFTVESKKAYILNNEPNLIYMTDMHVILYLDDGRKVNIISDKGRYNKVTYDCFFEQNVKATDGSTKIFAENLDMLATKNSAEVYNSVNLENDTGYLLADKIDYNFETKNFKISMFNDNAVKMKVTQ